MAIRLEIENYRCIRSARWDLEGVCALVGPNGSGKSTLLGALQFLTNLINRGPLNAAEWAGPGPHKNVSASRDDRIRFTFSDGPTAWEVSPVEQGANFIMPMRELLIHDGSPVVEQETGDSQFAVKGNKAFRATGDRSAVGLAAAALPEVMDVHRPMVERIASYRLLRDVPYYELRTVGAPDRSSWVLDEHGLNLFTLLRNWQTNRSFRASYDFVMEGLKGAFAEVFEDLDFEMAGRSVYARFYSPRVKDPFPIALAPTGMLQGICVLAAVASSPHDGIVAIDDFEIGLHPFAIERLIAHIREWSEDHGTKVILTTHSPVVLDRFNGQQEQVFVTDPAESTFPVRLTEHRNRDWLERFGLGDLYARQEFGAQRPVQ